ncbi:hypothetical protein EON63_24675 [archaeon]|nr:MAG: hypothetical protein EON63_24675 [archaeon]
MCICICMYVKVYVNHMCLYHLPCMLLILIHVQHVTDGDAVYVYIYPHTIMYVPLMELTSCVYAHTTMCMNFF